MGAAQLLAGSARSLSETGVVASSPSKSMNILYLHSHDTGRSIEPHGCPVKTPNLAALAKDGTFFRNAHCAAPTCSPSRAALLTGESAHQAGMVALAHRGGRLAHPERHLANFLGGHGFETVLAGIQHVASWKDDSPYSITGDDVDKRDGDAIADFAVNFLKGRGADKPFFMDVGFIETHRTEWVQHGFNQPEHSPKDGDGDADFVQPPSPLPDTPECRRDWLDFRFAVERLDGFYGRILAALDAAGLADETLVIATTDHGIAFPFHKCSLTASGTGVLQIIRGPKGFNEGKTVDAMVSHLDLYPTICEFLGLEKPAWLQGKALQSIVAGHLDVWHDELYAEVTFHAAFEPKRGVRTDRWNFLRNFAAPHTAVMANCDYGHSKQYLMERGMSERKVPKEELYDLVYDPGETNNLAESAEHANVVADLRARLADWMQRTDDPLLDPDPSVLPLPQTVNTWDQMNPGKDSVEWDTAQWAQVER